MLEALFSTILYCSVDTEDKQISAEDEKDRHSVIVFISTKMVVLAENIVTPESEQLILEKCKKVYLTMFLPVHFN